MCGAVGWHLSVNDLLAVMAAFRRHNTIVDPARAQTMLDRQFGLDVKKDTPLGRIYAKGGLWSSDGSGSVSQQSNVFFLPRGMELAILANSPLCTPNTTFMGQVLDAIDANIELRLNAIAGAVIGGITIAGLLRRTRARR
jgi:hypothetical protein